MAAEHPLLTVQGLTISTVGPNPVTLVDDVSLSVQAGQTLGLVGESGSGKSLTLRSLIGLLPRGVEVSAGSIDFEGRELAGATARDLRAVRGRQVGMIFQDPMTALNPVMTVGAQIAEAPRFELGLSRKAAYERAVGLMSEVGIPDAARRARAYPHEFSGGMRQRVMIAAALACSPRILLCDEPTTALDVTTQAQILKIIESLRVSNELAVVFVTHDLAVVAQLCEQVAVMYAGQIVEAGRTAEIFRAPRHAYTLGLLRSAPDLVVSRDRLHSIPGLPPDPAQASRGCRFAPRCTFSDALCTEGNLAPLPLLSFGSGERRCRCVHQDVVARSVEEEPVIKDA
ncbi:ABC transporter ATP-binding protein [Kribbella solani]|uniref:Oligopeptide/dipeptide ABC transporter ATP-binding protein n=1 Tax=Kribbella solani TaxID=236067 RepID=A0A841DQ46_9ACTN|nr:ABC transporter ATP-binding protein [Kribbella solani]MBB5979969.1 oligopeptide/dipeptide ABC transporter ATP-binding protein [Kribbella solani]MDX2968106.1 ABC transporter ATP-binding protein [Kribbella solani]